jgi:hypothetical protein
MAGIVKGSIDLTKIPKDKIIVGKKGKYIPVSITVNDEEDQFGNFGPIIVDQSKEEREAKAPKTYLGNVRVVWSNGTFPSPTPFQGGGQKPQPKAQAAAKEEEDLPF